MRTVQDCAELISGQHILEPDVNAIGDGEPYLTGPSDFEGLSPRVTAWTTRGLKFCECGDILITVKGSGCGTLARADRRYAISRQLMAIRAKQVDPDFLWCAIQQTVQALSNHAAGTIPGLTREQILGIAVPVPTRGSERSIADAVAWIEQTSANVGKLLVAKRAFKQGLMQQLLTGQKRFPEFRKRPWTLGRFDHFCEELSERNGQGLGPDLVMGVFKGSGFEPMRQRVRGKGNLSKYKVVAPGAFAYNPMRLNIGSIAYNNFGMSIVVSPDYEVFRARPGIADSSFVNQLRHSSYWISFMKRAGAGSVRVRIYFSDLARLRVPTPEVDEQSRIAAVLLIADTEIDQLSRLRELIEVKKRSLLFHLLSGDAKIPA